MNKLAGTIGIGLVFGMGMAACTSSHSSHAAGGGSRGTTSTSVTMVVPAPSSTIDSPSAPVSPSSSTSTAPPTSVTSVTSGSGTGPASGPRPCLTSQLKGSLTNPNGAAGSIYYQLVLTNTSSTTCVLDGYPGVSFVTGNHGQQVGAPAARAPGAVSPVTLTSGASSSASLQITDANNFAPCGITATDGLRVYPPNQQASLLIVHNDQTCSDPSKVTLHVSPFKA